MVAVTAERIRPALEQTYGKSDMVSALVRHLAIQIDAWTPRYPDETREDMIRETCWNWFSGGGTAQIAARRIEEALS